MTTQNKLMNYCWRKYKLGRIKRGLKIISKNGFKTAFNMGFNKGKKIK